MTTEESVSRKTKEPVIADMRSWFLLSEDWDGEGAHSPIVESIQVAIAFVTLLASKAMMPEPMLYASGRVGLLWENAGHYAELEFFPDRRIVYYAKSEKGTQKASPSRPVLLNHIFVDIL